MTYSIVFLLLNLSFLYSINNAYGCRLNGDSLPHYFLNLKGQILWNEKKLPEVTMDALVDSTNPFKTFLTDSNGRCNIQLPLQHYFTVKISKPGFVTKIISVDTHVPEKYLINYVTDFSGGLFEEIKGLDVSALKFPIAKINFDTLKRHFAYDSLYTIEINDRIKKLYDDFHELQLRKDSAAVKTDTIAQKITAPDSGKIPKLVVPQQKIAFFVQVFASSKEGKQKSGLFKELANMNVRYENGLYKYYTGEYSSYMEAEKFRASITKKFSDAFVIVFADGKKISLKEAEVLLSK